MNAKTKPNQQNSKNVMLLISLYNFFGSTTYNLIVRDHQYYLYTNSTTDNNACNGRVDEHINTKEEEVYQDLCALQRTSRSQVLYF